MLRWELSSFRLVLPVTLAVQVLLGAGFVVGVGLFFQEIPSQAALYLSTGVPVLVLILVGLVVGPQLVATQKLAQTYDFLWSLPVPRTVAALSWLTVNMALGIPGMVVALLVADVRYDLDLDVSALIVPAFALTVATSTLTGYALAHALPRPTVTVLVTQLVVFFAVGFAGVTFPPEQLPDWLAELNRFLPFTAMATVIRDGLTDGLVTEVGRAYVVLLVWLAGASVVTAWVLGRRR
jgi:ABC-2 type transport system permease protein